MAAIPQSFGFWYRRLQGYAALAGPCQASQDVWQA